MRVAIVAGPHLPVPPRRYGGTERIISDLIRGLIEAGHEPILLASADSEVDCELIPIVERAISFPADRRDLRSHELRCDRIDQITREQLRRLAPRVDLIHSHGFDLIDFQDMFSGPSAYDVASLCQDARVTVPAGLEIALRDQYVARRRSADPTFDVGAFHSAYAILAAVRNFKNLGVFARLAAIGRPAYLGHMPRLRAYLAGTLSHPVLSRLRLWYEGRLPS